MTECYAAGWARLFSGWRWCIASVVMGKRWQDDNATKTATNGRGFTNLSANAGRVFMASLFFRHELGIDELQEF
jgi:hypothetical protein